MDWAFNISAVLCSNKDSIDTTDNGRDKEPAGNSPCITHSAFGDPVKPIFHQKLCLRGLPNVNEIDTNKMKSTWPTRTQATHTQCKPYSTRLRWGSRWPFGLAFGFALAVWAHDGGCFGSARVFRYMFVFLTRNRRIGGLRSGGILALEAQGDRAGQQKIKTKRSLLSLLDP